MEHNNNDNNRGYNANNTNSNDTSASLIFPNFAQTALMLHNSYSASLSSCIFVSESQKDW